MIMSLMLGSILNVDLSREFLLSAKMSRQKYEVCLDKERERKMTVQ